MVLLLYFLDVHRTHIKVYASLVFARSSNTTATTISDSSRRRNSITSRRLYISISFHILCLCLPFSPTFSSSSSILLTLLILLLMYFAVLMLLVLFLVFFGCYCHTAAWLSFCSRSILISIEWELLIDFHRQRARNIYLFAVYVYFFSLFSAPFTLSPPFGCTFALSSLWCGFTCSHALACFMYIRNVYSAFGIRWRSYA